MSGSQNRKLKGPARKRQKNSNFPMGKAPSWVKNYIKVNRSHIPDTGIPKQPELCLPLPPRWESELSTPFPWFRGCFQSPFHLTNSPLKSRPWGIYYFEKTRETPSPQPSPRGRGNSGNTLLDLYRQIVGPILAAVGGRWSGAGFRRCLHRWSGRELRGRDARCGCLSPARRPHESAPPR